MTTEKKGIKRRIVIPLSGAALEAAMSLRAKRERETGEPTSLTAIVKAAVLAQRDKAEEV